MRRNDVAIADRARRNDSTMTATQNGEQEHHERRVNTHKQKQASTNETKQRKMTPKKRTKNTNRARFFIAAQQTRFLQAGTQRTRACERSDHVAQ